MPVEAEDFKISGKMTPLYLNVLGVVVLAEPADILSMAPHTPGAASFAYGVERIRTLTADERELKAPPRPGKDNDASEEVF